MGGRAKTAIEIAGAVRARQVSAEEAVSAALDRIADVNRVLNAFCEVRGSEALRSARALDAGLARGSEPGPLAGVPIAIKDCVWERGVDSTNGSRALLGFRPARSAVLVERLTAAGAIVIGRTNAPEFCYRGDCANELYGATSNPWDTSRTPGGSSGGSAAAVAAAVCPIAMGSDGGGSIRIPASFCGVVGLKPSFGLVPRTPGWPGWFSLNHVGPLATSVADVALALQVLAGPDASDAVSLPPIGLDYADAAWSRSGLEGLRIAASADLGYIRAEPAIRARFAVAVAQLEDLGAEVEWAHPELGKPLDTWNTLAFADNVASEGPLLGSGRVGADAAGLIALGAQVDAEAYASARNRQGAFAAAWHTFMSAYDLVVTPTMECVAFALGRSGPAAIDGEPVTGADDDWCHFAYPFNLTGQPAISVPMGMADGLPCGLQIVGRRFADDTVLRAAAAWEKAFPWHHVDPAAIGAAPDPSDASLAAIAGTGAWSVDLPDRTGLASGALVDAASGRARIRRLYSPMDGRMVAELEPLAPPIGIDGPAARPLIEDPPTA